MSHFSLAHRVKIVGTLLDGQIGQIINSNSGQFLVRLALPGAGIDSVWIDGAKLELVPPPYQATVSLAPDSTKLLFITVESYPEGVTLSLENDDEATNCPNLAIGVLAKIARAVIQAMPHKEWASFRAEIASKANVRVDPALIFDPYFRKE